MRSRVYLAKGRVGWYKEQLDSYEWEEGIEGWMEDMVNDEETAAGWMEDMVNGEERRRVGWRIW